MPRSQDEMWIFIKTSTVDWLPKVNMYPLTKAYQTSITFMLLHLWTTYYNLKNPWRSEAQHKIASSRQRDLAITWTQDKAEIVQVRMFNG